MLLSTSSQPSMKKGLHKIFKKEGLMKFVVDQFETKCEERASQDNQRGRPLDVVVDQFETRCERRTSQENQMGPLDFFLDQL